jgi:hypothetical protein
MPRTPAGGFRWDLPGASTLPPLRPVAAAGCRPAGAVPEPPRVLPAACLSPGVTAIDAGAASLPTWVNRSAAPSRIRVSSSLRVRRSNQPSALACTVPTIRPSCSANATRRCSTGSVAGVADCRVGWSDGVVVSLRLAMNSPFIGRYRDGAELRRSQHGTGHPALDQTRWRRAARRVKSGQKSGMPGGAIETPGRLPAIRAGRPSSSAGPREPGIRIDSTSSGTIAASRWPPCPVFHLTPIPGSH